MNGFPCLLIPELETQLFAAPSYVADGAVLSCYGVLPLANFLENERARRDCCDLRNKFRMQY